MKELDLHGLDHETAVDITENFLLLESTKGYNKPLEVKIITGNSPKLVIRIIREVLDKHNFSWDSIPHNPGVLIVSEISL
jgi:hypothetical protein